MDLLYSDNHLLVVSKKGGLPTQADQGENLHSQAKAWVKQEYKKAGNVFLEPIHRLDKPASGIVVFARTSKALSCLNEMMRERKIEKTYFAWVEGIPQPDEAVLTHFLTHGEHRAHVVPENHPEGKKAVLHYRVIEENRGNALLEIALHTGRYHQIRAQLAAIGHPIRGDQKYGAKPSADGTIALHHGKCAFLHPVTRAPLVFLKNL